MRPSLRSVLLSLAFVPASVLAEQPPSPADDVRAADVAFDRAVADHDAEAFKSLIADHAVFLGSGAIRGPEAVAAAWTRFLDPTSGFSLRWQPVEATAASSGELAFTIGEYTLTAPSDDGPQTQTGRYVTVWEKSDDGRWRVVADGSLLELATLIPESAEEGRVYFEPDVEQIAESDDLSYEIGEYTVSGEGGGTGLYFKVWKQHLLAAESGTPRR